MRLLILAVGTVLIGVATSTLINPPHCKVNYLPAKITKETPKQYIICNEACGTIAAQMADLGAVCERIKGRRSRMSCRCARSSCPRLRASPEFQCFNSKVKDGAQDGTRLVEEAHLIDDAAEYAVDSDVEVK